MEPLAISSYAGAVPLTDDDATLCLAWTLDERSVVGPALERILREVLSDELRTLALTNRYLVDDPYGDCALRAPIARMFELDTAGWHVTTSAGVGGALRSLAAAATRVTILGSVYPDFPSWLARAGSSVDWRARPPAGSGDLIFLERPTLRGETLSLEAIAELAAAAPTAVVLVDESNANYLSAAESAVTLAPKLRNLLVLRGLSKGFLLGGARVGYCVSSANVTDWLRARLPPLAVSSLSLGLAARVLSAGDLLAPLRARISEQRRALFSVVAAHVPDVELASVGLPYFLSRDEQAGARLTALGVVGKRHLEWSGSLRSVFRLSIPLDEKRALRLRYLLGREHV